METRPRGEVLMYETHNPPRRANHVNSLVAVEGACDDFFSVCRARWGEKESLPCAAFREEVYGALRNTER